MASHANFEVAVLSPCRAPRVTCNPILLPLLGSSIFSSRLFFAPAYYYNFMVRCCTEKYFLLKDSLLTVVVEKLISNNNSTSDRSIRIDLSFHRLLARHLPILTNEESFVMLLWVAHPTVRHIFRNIL
jgi:hypothetical protein